MSGWHSFDRTPWKHPWLSTKNLVAMKEFSDDFLSRVIAHCDRHELWKLKPKTAFVGNTANNLYLRAVPLRRRGMDIDIFLHPLDLYPMSYPAWEEFDGEIADKFGNIREMEALGIQLPKVEGVHQVPFLRMRHLIPWMLQEKNFWIWFRNRSQRRRWPFLSTVRQLQSYDSILSVQFPYVAMFSGKNYLVSQMSAEIWYEASRNDWIGEWQRNAYHGANSFLVSNPWSYSHARRLGLANLVHVPLLMDESKYSPGEPIHRSAWIEKMGGDFFVICTSRLDDRDKGSSLALAGFRSFSKKRPGARLVVLTWGEDVEKIRKRLEGDPILRKILFLPVAGKARLVEYLRSADCLLDQFVLGYYGATGIEAMMTGLPIVMRVETAQYGALSKNGPPPVENCEDENMISKAFEKLYDDSEYRARKRREIREWAIANHGSAALSKTYQGLLLATHTGFKWDYSDSPLNASLGTDERDYLSNELAHAPVYPNYY